MVTDDLKKYGPSTINSKQILRQAGKVKLSRLLGYMVNSVQRSVSARVNKGIFTNE